VLIKALIISLRFKIIFVMKKIKQYISMKEIKNSQELTKRIFDLLKEVPWTKINGYSAYNLHQIAMGNSNIDFVIVESARNEPFDMFVNDVKAMVNIMERSPRGRTIYAYRINGTENILFNPIVNKLNSAFEWYPKETFEKELPKPKSEKSKPDKKAIKSGGLKHNMYNYAK